MNYTAERIVEVWPRRFSSVADAQFYAHNPRVLANKVYNGRMGNVIGTDDGYNFRGRGATQLTGRENYTKMGQKLGLDLVSNPSLVNKPEYFMLVGVADFIMCNCLQPALEGNLNQVTFRLNGGSVGLNERRQWLAKWQRLDVELPVSSGQSTQVRVPKETPAPKPAPAPAPAQKTGFWSALLAMFASFMRKK